MATLAEPHRQQLSRHGIGASEIASICNMNPYASPWDVWLRKTGQAPDQEENAPMEWGIRLEPAIRQKYADETRSLIHVPRESLFSKEHAWARATPDGIVVNEPSTWPLPTWKHLLQCKNVGQWVGKSWDGGPPVYVHLQEQWEMYVTGLARADVAVLIGGNDFRVYTVHRDDKAISDLVTIAEAFWRKVESRTAPPVDDSDACKEHFERRLKRDSAIEVTADDDTERLFEEWRTLRLRQKADDKREKTIRNLVRQQLAEAGATVVRSTLGDAQLTAPAPPSPLSVVNWKYVAELVGSAKPDEFAEIVKSATATLTPEAKAPTLYAPRNWAKEE